MKQCKLCTTEIKRENFRDNWEFNRSKYCSRACYLKAHAQKFEMRICPNCETAFEVKVSSRQRICTYNCSRQGIKVFGTKYITTQGYVAIKTHGPNADSKGYELEHRMILEKELNRKLDLHEHVHHIDGNKQNNSRENLIVLRNSEHQREHKRIRDNKYNN